MTLSLRRGFSLVEVIIAIFLFATGSLALAATSGAIVRQLVSSDQRARAAGIATSRDEWAHASRCTSSSGSTNSFGIVTTWTIVAAGSRSIIEQTLERRDSKGSHTLTFKSGAPCD